MDKRHDVVAVCTRHHVDENGLARPCLARWRLEAVGRIPRRLASVTMGRELGRRTSDSDAPQP